MLDSSTMSSSNTDPMANQQQHDNGASSSSAALDPHVPATSLNLSSVHFNQSGGRRGDTEEANSPLLPIISITGTMRKGKSFLLNYLAQQEHLFPVSNKGACTSGIRIEMIPVRDCAKELVSGITSAASMNQNPEAVPDDSDSAHESDSNPVNQQPQNIAFLDVEGSGDIHINRDRDLTLCTLLLSSVILYNIQGYAPREEILKMLDLTLKSYEMMVNNGMLQKSSQVIQNQQQDLSEIRFGHLNIVIRDYQHSLTREHIWKELFEMEQVTEGDLRTSSLGSSSLDGKSQQYAHIHERNRIRRRLKRYFSSLHVWLLPQPTTESSALSQESIPFSAISPQFKTAVQEMQRDISTQICSFNSHGGNPFGLQSGQDVMKFLGNLFEMLSHDSLLMDSLVSVLEDRDMNHCVSALVESFRKQVDRLQLPEAHLEEKISTMRRQYNLRLKYMLGSSFSHHADEDMTQQDDSPLFSRAKQLLKQQLDSIALMATYKNASAQTEVVNQLINSLCKEVLQMMDPSSLSFHENFDEIVSKMEYRLREDPYIATLDDESINSWKKILRSRLKPYEQILESNLNSSLLQHQKNTDSNPKLKEIRRLLFEQKLDIVSRLPMKPKKLKSMVASVHVDVDKYIVDLGEDPDTSEEELVDMHALLDALLQEVKELNNLLIEKQLQEEIERIRETTRKMLSQYDIYQFVEKDSFDVQKACFIDDILSTELQPSIFSFLSKERHEEVEKQVETMCSEMYDTEAIRNRSLNSEALQQMTKLMENDLEHYKQRLNQEFSSIVPCNDAVLDSTITELVNRASKQLRSNILESVIRPDNSNNDTFSHNGEYEINYDSDDSADDTSSTDNQKNPNRIEFVLTPIQLDQLVESFESRAKDISQLKREENIKCSKELAYDWLSHGFKSNLESFYSSLFHDHIPAEDEIASLVRDALDNFLSYRKPGQRNTALRHLPLSGEMDSFKARIREQIEDLVKKRKNNQEREELHKKSTNAERSSSELLDVNRFLVKKIQDLKTQLESFDIVKKENETLRSSVIALRQRVKQMEQDQNRTHQHHRPTQPGNDSYAHQSSCANCGAHPIVGLRFQSNDFEEENLCEQCFLSKLGSDSLAGSHKVYIDTTRYLPNIQLLMKRIEDMGFGGETYFASKREMIHDIAEFNGDFVSLIPHLMKRQATSGRNDTHSKSNDEYLYKRKMLQDLGHLDDEKNRQLLMEHDGDFTLVARLLNQ